MDKAPDAYRTISEVADDLDLPQHVLRFWETRFSQIRPLKRGGGRRYYRPEDIDLLKGIRHLLYGEGYTIRGVQRIIKESGVKAIQALGRGEGAAALQKPKGPEIIDPGAGDDEPVEMGRSPALGGGGLPAFPPASYGEPPFAVTRREVEYDEEREAGEEPMRLEPAMAPRPALPVEEPAPQRHAPVQEAVRGPEPATPPQPVPEVRPVPRPVDMPSMRPATPIAAASPPAVPRLAADDVRRLQAALYELLECRKRLDAAFEGR